MGVHSTNLAQNMTNEGDNGSSYSKKRKKRKIGLPLSIDEWLTTINVSKRTPLQRVTFSYFVMDT
jgi:hypothetical protein